MFIAINFTYNKEQADDINRAKGRNFSQKNPYI